MKRIVIWAGFLACISGYEAKAGTDWCNGEKCHNPGYWYDVEERCTSE